MAEADVVGFEVLANADLVVDRVYQGGRAGTFGTTLWPG